FDSFNRLFVSLKQFISSASLGQFNSRLELIENFIMHVRCINQQHPLLQLLCNIFNYYKQFVGRVSARISAHRKELDREIQDKIKIIKWKERFDFFGLKLMITKSHRTIMRNMNCFEKHLQEPAMDCFYDENSIFTCR